MDITFSIVNQTITRTDQDAVVAGSRGYVYAAFSFSDDWHGLIKTAQFKRDDIVMDMLLVNDRCTVPWELLAKQGIIQVTVFGGDLITVNQAAIPVQPTGMSQANTPALLPTPNYYAQVIKALGVPGPQGPQGVQGIQGPQGPQGVTGSAVPIDDASSAADRVLSASYIKGQLAAKADKAQESWITPTLVNSWVNETGQVTRYMKDSMGFVHAEVFIKNGAATFQKVFDFIPGYRPDQIIYVVGVSGFNHAAAYITTGGSFDFAAGTLSANNRFIFSFKVV